MPGARASATKPPPPAKSSHASREGGAGSASPDGPAVLDEGESRLVELARAARERAYAPYSRFAVGAAVRAASAPGHEAAPEVAFAGCNVENASFGLTICAERNAVFQAVAAGVRHLAAVVVVTDAPVPTMPCGACRQVLREFGPDMVVIGATLDGKVARYRLGDLLPGSFGPEHLPVA